MKKSYLFILLLIGIIILPYGVSAAGSASIYASDTVVNGNSVTATVTLKNVASWNIKVTGTGATNGCSTHESDASSNANDITKKISVTCKANSLGTITFSFSGDVTSSDGTNTNVSGTKKVSVIKPREKSTNNNLKSLTVENAKLTPAFNKDTLNYSLVIEPTIDKINIKASLEDSYASLSGTGEKEITDEIDKFEIKVKSETGVEKIYTLNVLVEDSNPIVKTFNNKEYNVVKKESLLTLPSNDFTLSTVTINDTEIPAFYNETSKLYLIGLIDSDNNIILVKYNEKNDFIEEFNKISSESMIVLLKKTEREIDNFNKVDLEIDGKDYVVYQGDNKDYALVYGTNLKTNESGWYIYNIKDKSLQSYIFIGDIFNKNESNDNTPTNVKSVNQYKTAILLLSGLSLVLLGITIFEYNSKNKILNRPLIENENLLDNAEPIVKLDENMIVEDKKEEEKISKKEIESKEVKKTNTPKKEEVIAKKVPSEKEIKQEEKKEKIINESQDLLEKSKKKKTNN